MMKKLSTLSMLLALTGSICAADNFMLPQELVISADKMAADNVTATVVATGNVEAVAKPLTLHSDLVEKRGDKYHFAPGTMLTTCTNESSCLHWSGHGEIEYYGTEGSRYAVARNMVLRVCDIPVMWLPYWYYPLDTDYGWRIMPGYTSRWGAYILTKYVYHLAGEVGPESLGLSGSTRFDVRSENGIALGQGLDWSLGSFGHGKFKVYYAWDWDADRYDRKWANSRHWNYQNWGSKVPDERYAIMLSHNWQPTERDVIRLSGTYYSDSHFRSDFLRDGLFGHANRYTNYKDNELAWEHLENKFGFGVSVSGMLNEFYTGVSRLPEAFVDFAPQPIFGLPINWESSTRAGFLNRDYAKYGSSSTAIPFRYLPGEWADYQTFRFDTAHRFTIPFKLADVLSVVPRIGLRATFWDRAGEENLTGYGKTSSCSGDVWRTIAEGGVTFAARGTAQISEKWNHLVEPYLDVLAQEADYHGLKKGERPLIFDSHDASYDWLDQFAGRSRDLPYTWYGVTPGIRNAFRTEDENGALRTIFDIDVYASVQLNTTDYTSNDKNHRLVKNPRNPNYGEDAGHVVPGLRTRFFPSKETAFLARVEYDTENEKLAYAHLSCRHEFSNSLKGELSYTTRNHRWWDFAPAPYDGEILAHDDFNYAHMSYIQLSAEHEICDALAWGPFISWDFRDNQLDEVGSWFDIRTDCIGIRFQVSYENDYERVDRSRCDDDWRFGVYFYLRAIGAKSGSPF